MVSKIWNSDIARVIVPDLIGFGINTNYSLGVGVGFNIQGNILTRGETPGVYLTGGYTIRAGWELGLSASKIKGSFRGNPRESSINSLLGKGGDISGGAGLVSASAWTSLDDRGKVNWLGSSVGIGMGFGGSVGYGVTTLLGGF